MNEYLISVFIKFLKIQKIKFEMQGFFLFLFFFFLMDKRDGMVWFSFLYNKKITTEQKWNFHMRQEQVIYKVDFLVISLTRASSIVDLDDGLLSLTAWEIRWSVVWWYYSRWVPSIGLHMCHTVLLWPRLDFRHGTTRPVFPGNRTLLGFWCTSMHGATAPVLGAAKEDDRLAEQCFLFLCYKSWLWHHS